MYSLIKSSISSVYASSFSVAILVDQFLVKQTYGTFYQLNNIANAQQVYCIKFENVCNRRWPNTVYLMSVGNEVHFVEGPVTRLPCK